MIREIIIRDLDLIHWRKILAVCILFVCCSVTQAQEVSPEIYQLKTKDGYVFYGELINMNYAEIQLKTEEEGILFFDPKEVRRIKKIKPKRNKEDWLKLIVDRKYIWAPNAYDLNKGEFYYQNAWLIFHQVNYGISDRVSLGFGTIPAFIFGDSHTPVWTTPKLAITKDSEKINFAVGGLYGTVLGSSESDYGITYGIMTIGNRDRNIGIGLGYGYVGEDWAQRPTINLSGMFRTGPKGYFLFESYYLSEDDESAGILSMAGRLVLKRMSWDYGAYVPISGDIIGIIPWLSVSIKLGRL